MLTDTCIINGKTYGFSCNIRDDAVLRRGFNDLAQLVYGFNFEQWYANRYWSDACQPYVLTADSLVVANVSVNLMDFCFAGKLRRYIQIGTVMTHPQYRWQGLSRWLMERVLHDWPAACDGMYLYANDTVLEFYPKFGFVPAMEFKHACAAPTPDSLARTRKLNMDLQPDRQLLLAHCRLPNPYAALTMEHNPGLVMFHCTSSMRENVWYLEDHDMIVVGDHYNDAFLCEDIFGAPNCPLEKLLAAVVKNDTAKVVFGFTPKDVSNCAATELHAPNATFFVMQNKENLFLQNKLMLPLLSHA